MLKFFEKIYLLFDLLGVKFYRWQRGFSIWLSRKIRILKRIQYRRSIYAAGFCFGKKIGSRKIMHFFVVKTYKLNALKSNILATYIARELLLYFLVCFAFFFVVFFVNQILLPEKTILKKRVPVSSVLKLIVYCLPAIIAQSAPFATLVGFLMCLGRLVTDNEVLIFRASGQRYSGQSERSWRAIFARMPLQGTSNLARPIFSLCSGIEPPPRFDCPCCGQLPC